jgi:hypothetical protein
MDKIAKPEAEIFVLTVNQNAMGWKALEGIEWKSASDGCVQRSNMETSHCRLPHHGYEIVSIQNFNRTYLLDLHST